MPIRGGAATVPIRGGAQKGGHQPFLHSHGKLKFKLLANPAQYIRRPFGRPKSRLISGLLRLGKSPVGIPRGRWQRRSRRRLCFGWELGKGVVVEAVAVIGDGECEGWFGEEDVW
ncbi:hypothetical protein RHMOL_Rhmol06G0033100 [Rhododendron molle]|uniref:Uncharacterized protein n=1 Tax=Rhododendron molle TaxID=49168 RepID=A0ACC0NAJ5_RHOML|nr:hypothetical protein RHMOL_Rhmol06G0033100 [Rhododendron molle]